MSYILEALKKAEQQRELGEVPRIDSEHGRPVAGRSSRWGLIGVLALLVNAGVLLVLFWPSADAPRITPARQADSGNDAGPVVAHAQPQPARPVPAPAAQAAPSVAPVMPPAPAIRAPAPTVTTPPATFSPPARLVPAPRSAPARVTPPPVVSPPVVTPPPPESYRPAPVAAAPDVSGLPVWPQVPAAIFQRLQDGLRLDVHVYSERVADRFVLINLQKYREGERLQEGPVLDAITPEGAVLSVQGSRFLLRAQ